MVAVLLCLAAGIVAVGAAPQAVGNGTFANPSNSEALVHVVKPSSAGGPDAPVQTALPPLPTAKPSRGAARHGTVRLMDETPQYPFDPNTPQPCTWWWDNDGEIPCADMAFEWGILQQDFLRWNPSITPSCGNFLTGRSYCVEGPPAAGPSTTATDGSIQTPEPIRPGMAEDCDRFYKVKSGEICADIALAHGITQQQFLAWNPTVGTACTGLWAETWYCVKTKGVNSSPPTTTSAPGNGNGIETPTPIQQGMVSNCNAFATVRPTTTCQGILDWNKITLADFVKWNPAVGPTCGNLWANTWACIGVIGNNPSPPSTTTTKPGNGITTPSPTQPNMVSNCNAFATVRPTTTCQGILDWNKISLADFVKWNPSVGPTCGNLWANTWACIGVIGGSPAPPSTTTKPGNGITTPSPTQPNMVTNCNAFATVRPTTTCQGILDWNKISLANFVKWNPSVGKDCTNLWKNTWACIGVIGGSSGGGGGGGNAVETPTPIQAGMVTNCKAFATVRPTTTCQGILDWNKITMANFFKWNPAVKADCTNLWTGTWACIGV